MLQLKGVPNPLGYALLTVGGGGEALHRHAPQRDVKLLIRGDLGEHRLRRFRNARHDALEGIDRTQLTGDVVRGNPLQRVVTGSVKLADPGDPLRLGLPALHRGAE